MKAEDEQRLQELSVTTVKIIAGEYFARVFTAEDREREIGVIRDGLAKNTSMSSISNAIWANLQEALESISPAK